jgi:hypothetical protein
MLEPRSKEIDAGARSREQSRPAFKGVGKAPTPTFTGTSSAISHQQSADD